jgi:PilX N-terminal
MRQAKELMMKSMTQRMKGNEGSAFVISILVLFVLTVLGLALMLTTTTEKDIAINYKWGEQAFFNADAALEYGKNVLAAYALANQDFSGILPPARVDATVANDTLAWPNGIPDPAACNPATAGCRDYQYFIDQCQVGGGGPCTRVYIGKVLPRPDGTLAMWDFRAPGAMAGDLDNDGAADIEGTYTLWIRRPVVGTRDYGALPNENDRVVLTAEGTAPNGQGAGAGKPVSLRRLEMAVRLPSQGIEGPGYDDGTNPSDKTKSKKAYGGVSVN